MTEGLPKQQLKLERILERNQTTLQELPLYAAELSQPFESDQAPQFNKDNY